MTLRPARGILLVRPIESAERLPGARIILTADTRERLTANQCEVVAVGGAALCEDEECERDHHNELCDACIWAGGNYETDECCTCTRSHPTRVRSGDWLLVTPRSFIAGPNPERAEYFVHQDAVLGIFNDGTTI